MSDAGRVMQELQGRIYAATPVENRPPPPITVCVAIRTYTELCLTHVCQVVSEMRNQLQAEDQRQRDGSEERRRPASVREERKAREQDLLRTVNELRKEISDMRSAQDLRFAMLESNVAQLSSDLAQWKERALELEQRLKDKEKEKKDKKKKDKEHRRSSSTNISASARSVGGGGGGGV